MVYHGDAAQHRLPDFEVDSTESVWYSLHDRACCHAAILKLTPQSQYGIKVRAMDTGSAEF